MKNLLAATVLLALAPVPVPAMAQEPVMTSFGMMGLRIGVKNEERSKAFYRVLGMKDGRLYHPGQQEMIWKDGLMGPAIVLVTVKADEKRYVPGTASFMVRVSDIFGTAKGLRAAGFPEVADPKPSTNSYTILIVSDPDGNMVELIGPTPKR